MPASLTDLASELTEARHAWLAYLASPYAGRDSAEGNYLFNRLEARRLRFLDAYEKAAAELKAEVPIP